MGERYAFLVHHFLEHSAQADPDATALVHEGMRMTYGELESAANRLARVLVKEGVRPGDRVGIVVLNSRLYVEAYYAVLKAGAIAVSLNTAADGRTVQALLRDCEAKALIAGPRFGTVVCEALPRLPDLSLVLTPGSETLPAVPAHVRHLSIEDAVGAEPDSAAAVRRIDLDRAAIIYTSGSTGRPRGAVLSHLNLVSNTRSIVSYLGLGRDDRVLALLPYYYVYGKSLLNSHFAAGGAVIIENRFAFPQVALDTLEREEATGLAGVPSTFAILLNRTNFARRPLSSLRYVTQAGGAMAPELIRRLIDALPGKRVFIMYGATEAGARLSFLEPAELPRKIGSVGKAIPNVEIRVLRDDGTEAAPGETGELVARGSNIMEGYWGDPGETAKVLDRNGFHTGDLGWTDEEGFLHIAGRSRDMIKSGAHRIHPKEIEDVLLEHPEVHEVAVIGVSDEVLGEAVKAYVVFRRGSTASTKEILEFCNKRLPLFKMPKAVEAREELPKNPSGKIMKDVLRAESAIPDPESRS